MRMHFSRAAAVLILMLSAGSPATSKQTQPALPKVLVLATGGTIAGEQREPGTQGPYEIRKSAAEVVDLVPEIRKYARVETEQFLNVASSRITPELWLQLAKRINTIFAERPDLSGLVVTHGTDRLQETAFFLHLTVRSARPVVIVGAYRPPTGISPDGPLNLLSAVRVAAAPEARDKGALIVMDEQIISARDAQKLYARAGGFNDNEMGTLGIVAPHGVEFFYTPTRKHTVNSEFDVSAIRVLPRVDVQYLYAGAEPPLKTEARGIVVATTALSPSERSSYDTLQKAGVVVATTFPSGAQVVSPASPYQEAQPMIAVKRLLPTHARILLMLALTKTSETGEIQRIFDVY
jgi:L-asparaginase type II